MRIEEILTEVMVLDRVVAASKDDALHALATHMAASDGASVLLDAEHIYEALANRERLGSTGVGEGVAIPHAKIPGLQELHACFARVPDGVPFDAIDQKPVRLLFVLLVPEKSAGTHLKALARVSRLLKSAEFRARLLEQAGAHEIYTTFLAEDSKS